jgi:ribonuclease VapC
MTSGMMIVDTSALVAILTREPEREGFLDVLGRNEPVLPATCLVELSMVLSSRNPSLGATFVDGFLASFKIDIVSITPELARAARSAFFVYGKGRHAAGLNFGDCFSYALAKELDVPLLFKGTDFSKTDVRLVTLEGEPS